MKQACMQSVWQKQLHCTHRNFETSIKSWINTIKVHKVIQFNQKAWFKLYINMNTKLRREA